MTRLLLACWFVPVLAFAADDFVVADFEGKDYGAWKVTGTAFGPGPARGTLPGQMPVSGFRGNGLVNTFFNGDRTTGTLTSPEFTLSRRYLSFLIGGGKDAEKLALQLLVDGKVVRSATGTNDKPGGSEALEPGFWDVGDLAGKKATLRIVDEATGPWGHINVDHLVLSDRKPPVDVSNAERVWEVKSRYLHLPIKTGAKKRVVTLLVDGKEMVRNDIELADGKPDWWAPLEVQAFRGQKVTLRVDRLPEDSAALKSVTAGDTPKEADDLYREPLRGQLRFSARRGWLNDPNGLVYHNGEYHLFFQHNPYGWAWGNMHWGHAVSKDLVHWEEQGDKLWPDAMGPMFSGSAVVDHANTSGLGRDGKPPLVLLYTAAGNPTVQGLAHGVDGRSFTKWAKNPVLKQITPGNRDPKVIWHAPSKKWIMVLYVELKRRHTVHFFMSPNLIEWTLASIVDGGTMGKDGYLYECPDFFPLAIEGDPKKPLPNKTLWVLLGANSEYALGSFDGTTFTPEKTWLRGHHGRGFYAPQTFDNIPAKDGRRIQIGWFQTETKGMPFNQAMSLPHELRLLNTPEGPRLARTPVKELAALRTRSVKIEPTTLKADSPNPLAEFKAELQEWRVDFTPGKTSETTLLLRGVALRHDATRGELRVDGLRVPVPLREGKVRLTVFVDRTGLEIFAAEGLVYVPLPLQPRTVDQSASVQVKGDAVHFSTLEVHAIRSIWNRAR